MTDKTINKIAIVGGGTAGWMAAASLANEYAGQDLQVQLVESEAIAPVGVGEATVPGIHGLHQRLGISERDFLRATNATFKLGIEFCDWRDKGTRFFHPFADYGMPIDKQDFYQCWLKLHKQGRRFDLERFCLSTEMARENRFALPDYETDTPIARYNYAYHFDAALYGQFLRRYAEQRGVQRIEGQVVDVALDADSGDIQRLQLADGQTLSADLFIDCTGFYGLLIDKTLGEPWIDWTDYLPCDRAVVAQTEKGEVVPSYTRSTALSAGWQWRIPLVHRTGNGYVYSSQHLSDEAAEREFRGHLTGELLTQPRVIRFGAGMRRNFWRGNCVALGLSSGFVEPLESTSISLIQTGVEKLLRSLPERRLSDVHREHANEANRREYERIRDFLVLHYIASARRDSDFWRDAKNLPVPDTLAEKLRRFRHDGEVLLYAQESFVRPSWLSMYNGFGIVPQHCQLNGAGPDAEKLDRLFGRMQDAIARAARLAPPHGEFLADV